MTLCIAQSPGAVEYLSTAPLQRGTTPTNEYRGYDPKQSDGEVPVMLEFWGMQSTSSLPSLPGPLWSQVIAQDSEVPVV